MFRWVMIVLTALLMGLGAPGESLSTGERHRLETDAIDQVEQTLKQAAAGSPRWHSKQESIQRDIYDISYLLEQAIKASRAANHAARDEYARQALTLLQRAINRGHFRPEDVAPVLAVIQRLLPNPSV